MGKFIRVGDSWHDTETKALRESLHEAQFKLAHKEAELIRAQQDFAESHHRIANNLQIIISFLQMQSRSAPQSQLQAGLHSAVTRIEAVARLHAQLRRQVVGSELDFGEYITRLGADLGASTGARCTVRADPILLSEQLCVDLAIAVNELAINAAKYARGEDGVADIEISCSRDDGQGLSVMVRDHGPGLPDGFDQAKKISQGFSFVRAIVAHHKGQLLIENDAGARLIIRLPRL